MQVLDVGCGIGGPARFFAEARGCHVTGIDLTEEFVQVATELTRRCGLSKLASFRQGSALDLPFDAGSFDAATLIHVGMNIADKAGCSTNVRRVLKPGALFCVYDVMRADEGDLPYPMPWAQTAETSFVETPETYRRLLERSRLQDRARGESARIRARAGARDAGETADGLPPLPACADRPGWHERLANVMATLERGTIAPVEMIARGVKRALPLAGEVGWASAAMVARGCALCSAATASVARARDPSCAPELA